MKIVLGTLLAIPLSLGLLLYATGLAVVEVEQHTPDGIHVIVPVPLALANAALMFVDDDRARVRCPEFAEHREMAVRLARELAHSPDGRFVEVESRDERVTIDKTDNILVVEVHDGADEVLVRVPVDALVELLESYDGESFQASDLIAAVRRAPGGEWVRVHDGENDVRIWSW
jgi:hypothetical protein